MSTLEEALVTRHRLSEYHIYRDSPSKDHMHITPICDITKESGHRKKNPSQTNDPPSSSSNDAKPTSNNQTEKSYFVHRPLLTWHDPPRTLRRGDTKHGKPVCVINSVAFWREWNIQFSQQLDQIIDPRGLVRWVKRSRGDNKTDGYNAFKGYKVRTWRSWGESGKEYHRQVNSSRKELQETGVREEEEEEEFEPVVADEAVQLSWSAPFSGHTRQYEFTYGGINFFWEGTRDIPIQTQPDKWTRRLMPFNHLKLMAMRKGEKVFVGQFVCSFSAMKYGRLWIFDSVIQTLLEESSTEVSKEKIDPDFDIRNTRLYDLVMATAVCMVVGEWQKRLTLKTICVVLLSAAGNYGQAS